MRVYCSLLLLLVLVSCEKVFRPWRLEPVEFLEMSVPCACAFGCSNIVITSQQEFEALIAERFTRYLDEHWERNYPDVYEAVERNNPNLSEDELAALAYERMFEFMPFVMIKDCNYPDSAPMYNNPEIDFSEYTLVGTSLIACGCKSPNYSVEVLKDEKCQRYIFSLDITTYGSCEMAISISVYGLIPKISDDYVMEYEFHTRNKHKW